MRTTEEIRSHPAFGEIFRRYHTARLVWRSNPDIQRAAQMLGMSEREYCGRFVAMNFGGVITWTGTSTTQNLTDAHYSVAFEDASS